MMKRLALVSVTIGAALAIVGCGGSSSSSGSSSTHPTTASGQSNLRGQTITFAGFGGSNQNSQKIAWADPFSKATGATILQAGPIDYSKVKVQVQTGNVQWDTVDADAFEVTHNCGTLFQPLPSSYRSNIIPSFITTPCGVPIENYAIAMAYDKKKFANVPPKSWADFFNTTKYPGKRGIWNFPLTGALEAALLADGVPTNKLYPLDLKRAFAKLQSIKGSIVFADTLAQLQEQLVNHDVAMSLMWNGRGYAAFTQGAGANYAMQWNQNLRGWDDFAILKGTPHLKAAEAFAKYVGQPAAQARYAELEDYGSLTYNTHPKLTKLQEEFYPTDPAIYKMGININQTWWGDNYDLVNSMWTSFVSG